MLWIPGSSLATAQGRNSSNHTINSMMNDTLLSQGANRPKKLNKQKNNNRIIGQSLPTKLVKSGKKNGLFFQSLTKQNYFFRVGYQACELIRSKNRLFFLQRLEVLNLWTETQWLAVMEQACCNNRHLVNVSFI
jgi:hypothetical protein